MKGMQLEKLTIKVMYNMVVCIEIGDLAFFVSSIRQMFIGFSRTDGNSLIF